VSNLTAENLHQVFEQVGDFFTEHRRAQQGDPDSDRNRATAFGALVPMSVDAEWRAGKVILYPRPKADFQYLPTARSIESRPL
jgi:hypothetical protein